MTNLIPRFFAGVALLGIALIVAQCSSDDEVKLSKGPSDEAIKAAQDLDKASYAGLENIFLDTKEIVASDEKPALIIFSKNNCLYCDKLKEDIKKSQDLQDAITKNLSPYYVNISYSKTHSLSGIDSSGAPSVSSFSTIELASRYITSSMRPTPTLVFINGAKESIYELPGYLPTKQLLALLDYINNGEWKDKSKEQIQTEIGNVVF